MKICAIKAFSDNYIWSIEKEGEAVIVDPGEGKNTLHYLEENGLDLKAILLTHKHPDHIDGVEELKKAYPRLVVYGPEEIPGLERKVVKEGDKINLLGLEFSLMETRGHTLGHVSYLLEDKLFCGDALFVAGCGRNFSGDYGLQFRDLQKIKALKEDTKIYGAHEYSLNNLSFAKSVDRDNEAIDKAKESCQKLLDQGKGCFPTSLGEEKSYNPFLRARDLEEFIELRKKKDAF